jgi:hypothetical protein
MKETYDAKHGCVETTNETWAITLFAAAMKPDEYNEHCKVHSL